MLCCAVRVDAGSDLVMSHAQVYDVTDRLLLSTMRNIEGWLSVSHSVTPCYQWRSPSRLAARSGRLSCLYHGTCHNAYPKQGCSNS